MGADKPRDPIDDITVRTQCELLVLYGKKLKVCAEGYAEVEEEGGTIHCQPIPEGYAKVFVLLKNTGKTWASRSLSVLKKQNYNMSYTHGSLGQSTT